MARPRLTGPDVVHLLWRRIDLRSPWEKMAYCKTKREAFRLMAGSGEFRVSACRSRAEAEAMKAPTDSCV